MKMEINKKKDWIAIFIPHKIDFKATAIYQETKKDPVITLLGIYLKKPKH